MRNGVSMQSDTEDFQGEVDAGAYPLQFTLNCKEGGWKKSKDEEIVLPHRLVVTGTSYAWEFAVSEDDFEGAPENRYAPRNLQVKEDIERAALSHVDEDSWPVNPYNKKEKQDPWLVQRMLHLLNPLDNAEFTFKAWRSDLKKRAFSQFYNDYKRQRSLYPKGYKPVVELDIVEVETRYGKNYKPVFRIVGWCLDPRLAGAQVAGVVTNVGATTMIEHHVEKATSEPESLKTALKDEVAF